MNRLLIECRFLNSLSIRGRKKIDFWSSPMYSHAVDAIRREREEQEAARRRPSSGGWTPSYFSTNAYIWSSSTST